MQGWSGRIDPSTTSDARRWHQIVQAYAAGAPPGTALLGFACDEGILRNGGRIGAAQGPQTLRPVLASLPVMDNRPLYDTGDVECLDGNLEQAQSRFAERVCELLGAGHRPIGLGGGHEIAFATYQGLFRSLHERRPRIAVVNLDAHFDLREQEQGSSGTPFLQILKHAAAHALPVNYLCLGVSASANTRQLFATADAHDVYYLHDDELDLLRLETHVQALRQRLAHVDMIYLSLCLDVLPNSVVPGVSAPSARGVPQEVLEPLIDAILGTGKVAVADVAELSPPHDNGGASTRVAARLVHRMARGMDCAPGFTRR